MCCLCIDQEKQKEEEEWSFQRIFLKKNVDVILKCRR